MQLVTPETRRQLQATHPQAATQIANLGQVLDSTSIDAGLLDLCSSYFDAALRDQDWAPPAPPTELEAACLEVCAQFMLSVANMSNTHIAALSRHLSADDVYNLMYAIYLIEGSKRLDITLERVLS